MEHLISAILEAIKSGNISDVGLVIIGFVLITYVIVNFLFKALEFFKKNGGSGPNDEVASKSDVATLGAAVTKMSDKEISILDELKDKLNLLTATANDLKIHDDKFTDKINGLITEIEHLKDSQGRNVDSINIIKHELTSVTTEVKLQGKETTRQLQDLQRELASLHGLIVGLNTSQQRLK
ncbi:hypothetical protein RsoM2USA_432 [Ralstonia phage RsoM2USA]|nr:hypothetical protein RsoM2USA_432 [Ralstonia phage RsoM2USA]